MLLMSSTNSPILLEPTKAGTHNPSTDKDPGGAPCISELFLPGEMLKLNPNIALLDL
jgi:hypothetical protein